MAYRKDVPLRYVIPLIKEEYKLYDAHSRLLLKDWTEYKDINVYEIKAMTDKDGKPFTAILLGIIL